MFLLVALILLLGNLPSSTRTTAHKQTFKTRCPPGTFPCFSGGQCFNNTLRCDGQADCKDGTDEGSICDTHMNIAWGDLYRKRHDDDKQNTSTDCSLTLVPEVCRCRGETRLFCDNKTLIRVPSPLPRNTSFLDLSLNNITDISMDSLQSSPSLDTLVIDHSYVKTIAKGAFQHLFRLTRMDLNYNLLTNFSTDVFTPFNVLRELNLKGNQLTTLRRDDFTNMNHLQRIDLSRNKISVIGERAFGALPALRTIDLRKNQLTEIRPHYFYNLRTLSKLYLSENHITGVLPGSFQTLAHLDILDLARNAVRRLDDGAFDGLFNLSTIFLARNEISVIQSKALKDFVNVKSVDLRSNPLRHLDNQTMRHMKGLDYVYFDKFYMCIYASQARVCEPQGDGISSKQNLLGNIVLRICVWVVAILSCGGNLIVILGRFLMKENNQIHSFFIKNLSLADLIMGVYLLLIAATDIKFRGVYIMYDELWRKSWQCNLSGFLSTLSTEMSVLTLSVITLDRYLSIMYPLSFRKRELKLAYLVMAFTWLSCILLAAIPVMGIDYFGSVFYSGNAVCVPLHLHEPRARGWEYSSFLILGINFASFTFIAYAYVAMFHTIHKSALPLRTSTESRERSLVKRFSFIVVTDFMCWVPIIVIKIMALGGIEISGDLYAWVVVFALPVNSALNPLLYTLTTNLFKKKLLSKFTVVFRTESTQSSAKNSMMRQIQACEMGLLRRANRSPSHSTVKTYLSPGLNSQPEDLQPETTEDLQPETTEDLQPETTKDLQPETTKVCAGKRGLTSTGDCN